MLFELYWLKKDVNDVLVGIDWLNMLVDGGENKVTSFNLTKYDLQPHTWTLKGMQTKKTAVDENGYDFAAFG